MHIRTRAFFAAAALFVLTGLASVPARADDAAARKTVMDLFNKTAAAIKKKDIKAFMAVYTSDYTQKGGGVTSTRQQLETQMKQIMSQMKSLDSATLKLQKVTTKGKTILAEGTAKFVMTLQDAQGAKHTLSVEGLSRDTFVQTKSGWQTKLSEELGAQKVLIDGRPLGAPGGGQ